MVCLIFGVGGGAVLLLFHDRIPTGRLVISSIGVLCCLGLLIGQLRSFRFRITPQGLDLYHRGIKRMVPWSEVETIALGFPANPVSENDRSPRVLLVPVPGSDLRRDLTETIPGDGRAARVLLDTDDVKNSVDDISGALAQAAGDRFADLRGVPRAATQQFTVVLRGYAPVEVDPLIKAAYEALYSTDTGARERARQAIESRLAGGPPFAVALRGYDRSQVEALLPHLAAQLGGKTVNE